jgi:TldD protein
MRVDQFSRVGKQIETLSHKNNLYSISRIQSRRAMAIEANNGRTEEITTAFSEGMGIQVFTEEGFSGFAAADSIDAKVVAELFAKAAFLAIASKKNHSEPNRECFKLQPLKRRLVMPVSHPVDSVSLPELERLVLDFNRMLKSCDERLAVRSVLRTVDDEWRIFRSDGTDVSFNTPRTSFIQMITAKSGSETASSYAYASGTGLEIILAEETTTRLELRARRAVDLSLALLAAGRVSAGHYKLVIDYALAKGLAHEAFGHAAETDHLDSSILGDQGKLRIGMQVADPRLSIVDESIPGDNAYQPFSAIGTERQRVTIIDHGILAAGLADIFSAASAGVAPTGAERVESFAQLPIARMSNIRIEFQDPLSWDGEFETITPQNIRSLLLANDLMQPDEKVLYLTGFRGGQVNPAFGDFVFHCSGIYELAEEPVLYKPAIFSGKVLSALKAVFGAIGPLRLDAIGTCGKMGQGVPSGGGSHYFLVLEADPEITVGGE